jgi:hypothetical protein
MGTIEFFNPNNVCSKCTYAFTTASLDNAPFLYDNDVYTTLSSDNSADGVLEKFEVFFDSAKLVDSLLLCNHNFKTGNIKYLDDTLTEQDFSPAIAWTTNTALNHFYAVTEVTACYGIVVNVTHTIDGSEKSIGELRALDKFTELPNPTKIVPINNIEADEKKKYDGGIDKVINGVKFEATINFDNLTGGDVNSTDDNISVLNDLYERGRPFYIYMSSLSANKTKKFYRVCDMFLVNSSGDLKIKPPKELIDDVLWEADLKVKEV